VDRQPLAGVERENGGVANNMPFVQKQVVYRNPTIVSTVNNFEH
jgi:hypothetical protein